MTGATWAIVRESFPELLPRLVVKGTVFARMSPEQKQQLVGHLQELGYYVGMLDDSSAGGQYVPDDLYCFFSYVWGWSQ